MPIRSCRVTIPDMDGVSHSGGKEWVAGIAPGVNVKVSIADIRVEHEVKLSDFTKWLDKPGGVSPREVSERQRIRSILGMPFHDEQ